MGSIDVTGLNCAQLEAMKDAGDAEIETLYLASRTNPTNPLSGAPRLSYYTLARPIQIDQTNLLWMNVYRAQLAWRTTKNTIIQQQRKLGCFQII